VVIRWLPWLPAVLAVGFTVWLVSRFSVIIGAVHLDPDADFAPVLVGDLRAGTTGGVILVGQASHLTAIGFLYLTRSLPFREVIWDWGPYVTFLVGLSLGAWACWRVAGPWAAVMTFSAGACAEASVLRTVMSEGIRGHTFFAVAAMCALLVLLVEHPDLPTWKKTAAGGLAVAVAGSTVASDPLFLVVGLGPFVGAAFTVWLLRRDRHARSLALLALGIAGGALIVSQLIWVAVRSLGVKKNYLDAGYSIVDPGQVIPNLWTFLRHVLLLTHAAPLTHPSRATLAQLAMTLVIAAIAVYAFGLLFQLRRRPGLPDGDATSTALLGYTAFWVLIALADMAAFALSSFSAGPSDTTRYVIPVFLALAAVGPLWGRRLDWRRPVAAVGLGLFCLASIAGRQGLFWYRTIPWFGSIDRNGAHMVSFLESEGLKYGYGGYETSHQLTLLADLKVHVFPAIACHQPESDTICPLFVNVRTAWYVPRPGVRSFLIYEASVPALISPLPSKSLGPPTETRTFGTMTVFVFDYDIASKFSPPCMNPGAYTCPAKT